MRLQDLAFDADATAVLLLDDELRVAGLNPRARSMFGLRQDDVGKALAELDRDRRPVELLSLIDQATHSDASELTHQVSWTTPAGDALWLDLHLLALVGETGRRAGFKVQVYDITAYRLMEEHARSGREELDTARRELKAAHEELESTVQELQATAEELEAAHTTLQSMHDELEALKARLRQQS